MPRSPYLLKEQAGGKLEDHPDDLKRMEARSEAIGKLLKSKEPILPWD